MKFWDGKIQELMNLKKTFDIHLINIVYMCMVYMFSPPLAQSSFCPPNVPFCYYCIYYDNNNYQINNNNNNNFFSY